jgi:hypothetical protein
VSWYKRVERQDARPHIQALHAKRDLIRQAALKHCESKGHVIFDWNPFNSSRCRKCGRTVFCQNIFAQTAAPDYYGAACDTPCDVHLDGGYFGHFEEPKSQCFASSERSRRYHGLA